MDAPEYKQPPLDPSLALLMQQTQQQDINAVQSGLRGDTASLMARYGSRLALANNGGSAGAAGMTGSPLSPPVMA